jgi:hypothetical protein
MEPLNEEFLPKTEHGDFFPRLPWNYPKTGSFFASKTGERLLIIKKMSTPSNVIKMLSC